MSIGAFIDWWMINWWADFKSHPHLWPLTHQSRLKVSEIPWPMKETVFGIEDAVSGLTRDPETMSFSDFLRIIDKNFRFIPCSFQVGRKNNQAWESQGSLKVLAYAVLMGYDTEQALILFGEHYRNVRDKWNWWEKHENIIQLMEHGIESVKIYQNPLILMR